MKEQASILFQRYFEGSATADEMKELWKLLEDPEVYASLQDVLSRTWHTLEQPDPSFAIPDAARFRRIIESSPAPDRLARRIHFLRPWHWVAAAVILLMSIGSYQWIVKRSTHPVTIAAKAAGIAPGKAGAILTLADGSQVVLDSSGNKMIAQQNGTQVRQQRGQLFYDPTGKNEGAPVYNTMTTPKGRQFQLILPDGTKVWLNAASSLKYPTVFTGKERLVEVTGEAYFEVVKDTKRPFRVNVNHKAEVDVLGTHFNVNAYDNEHTINTTLLEGSVSITTVGAAPAAVILKSGQQAQIAFSQQAIKVENNVDIDKVMAWKNGLFNFNGVALEEVMRQLERWYDIEVVYEKGIPKITFWGEMTKDFPLEGLLIVLKKSEVHFRIEGRKLIVLP